MEGLVRSGKVLFHLEGELLKVENGGPGLPGETVVSPRPLPVEDEPVPAPVPEAPPLPNDGAQ